MKWRGILGVVLLLTIAPRHTFAAAPTLTHLFPAGAQRGTKITTTCTGKFNWPCQVWAPGIDVKVGKEKGKLEITVPENISTDRVWIRLYNQEGTSTVKPFLIGNLAEYIETEPNDAPQDAQEIAYRIVVNGVLQTKGDVDSFAVRLEKGQTIVAALDAHTRLGSPMDAMLQICSRKGTVLSENHDAVGLDPRIVFTAPSEGLYLARVFSFSSTPNTNISYQGGANYIYRLTLSTGPYVTHVTPISVDQSTLRPENVFGWNIPAGVSFAVNNISHCPSRKCFEFEHYGDLRNSTFDRIGFFYSKELAGHTRFRLSSQPVSPLNLTTASTTEISIPNSVNGIISNHGQTKTYRMRLPKGKSVIVSVEATNLYSSLIPRVQWMDPKGKVVAQTSEGGGESDAILTHTTAMDGEYQLSIRDRYGHGSDLHFYRLSVRFQEPDFLLTTNSDHVTIQSDKPTDLVVNIQRRTGHGQDVGSIKIRAMDLPEGVISSEEVSELKGDSAKKVTLKLASNGKPHSGPIRIQGFAEQPQSIMHYARAPMPDATSIESVWLTVIAKKSD